MEAGGQGRETWNRGRTQRARPEEGEVADISKEEESEEVGDAEAVFVYSTDKCTLKSSSRPRTAT